MNILSSAGRLLARATIAAVVAGSLLAVDSVGASAAPLSASGSASCRYTGTGLLRVGSSGTAVRSLQDCLARLGYMTGGIEGAFGPNTFHAVVTFQKDHNLGRDGIVGPVTRASLATSRPVAMPIGCRSIDRVCVSLSKQVMYLRLAGGIKAVDTSTGTGLWYVTAQGARARAVTPTGHAVICRQVNGLDRSTTVTNGVLYDPSYLSYGGRCSGVAFHGAGSVPSYPASHGCMRVVMTLSRLVHDNLRVGSPVSVVS